MDNEKTDVGAVRERPSWPAANDNVLHITGQGAWHDDVFIKGTRRALESLRVALVKVLFGAENGSLDTSVNDGEGYTVHVELTDDPAKLELPYYEDYARGINEDGLVRTDIPKFADNRSIADMARLLNMDESLLRAFIRKLADEPR